jgi:hypothetical protein
LLSYARQKLRFSLNRLYFFGGGRSGGFSSAVSGADWQGKANKAHTYLKNLAIFLSFPVV